MSSPVLLFQKSKMQIAPLFSPIIKIIHVRLSAGAPLLAPLIETNQMGLLLCRRRPPLSGARPQRSPRCQWLSQSCLQFQKQIISPGAGGEGRDRPCVLAKPSEPLGGTESAEPASSHRPCRACSGHTGAQLGVGAGRPLPEALRRQGVALTESPPGRETPSPALPRQKQAPGSPTASPGPLRTSALPPVLWQARNLAPKQLPGCGTAGSSVGWRIP